MTPNRDAVKAYRDAMLLAGVSPDENRMRIPTDGSVPNAIGLASELSDDELNHPNQIRTELAVIEALKKAGEPKSMEGRISWYRDMDAAAKGLWDAFAGQVVEGVEIVRAA